MAATFTWIVEECVRDVSTGGIIEAHWRCNASETESSTTYTSTIYGVQRLLPDSSSPDFIPYSAVTESDVLGWLWASSVEKALTETSLQTDIDDQKAPQTAEGVPWT